MGNEKEIEAIYRRNVDTVYRVCFSFMKNRADTEDIVQEVFVRLLDSKVCFASPEHEKGWLIVTASNLCKNALKHWWRKNEKLEDCAWLIQEQEPETGDVIQAILELPGDYKTAVYLFYYEGYQTPEIARMLNVSPATVRSRLFRARRLLKDMLGGEPDARSPAKSV